MLSGPWSSQLSRRLHRIASAGATALPVPRAGAGGDRWPTGHGDCIGTLEPREGAFPRKPERRRPGAAGRLRTGIHSGCKAVRPNGGIAGAVSPDATPPLCGYQERAMRGPTLPIAPRDRGIAHPLPRTPRTTSMQFQLRNDGAGRLRSCPSPRPRTFGRQAPCASCASLWRNVRAQRLRVLPAFGPVWRLPALAARTPGLLVQRQLVRLGRLVRLTALPALRPLRASSASGAADRRWRWRPPPGGGR